MTGGSPDAVNRSHVEQTRIDPMVTNNAATVNISGAYNLSYLYQIGAENKAQHDITGFQNTIIAKSYGNSLQSFVVQEGYRLLRPSINMRATGTSAISSSGTAPPAIDKSMSRKAAATIH